VLVLCENKDATRLNEEGEEVAKYGVEEATAQPHGATFPGIDSFTLSDSCTVDIRKLDP
jgi:hypothetical protein